MAAADQPDLDNSTLMPTPAKKSSLSKSVKLIIVLSIVGILVLFASFSLLKIVEKKQTDASLAVTQQVKKIEYQQLELNNRYQEIQTLAQNLERSNQQMQQAIHNLSDQSRQPQPLWLLLQVRYYLELAQVNIHWNDNNEASLRLLEAADQQLAHLTNQDLFPIRQAIAREIASVKAQPFFDRAGLLSQLDAAQDLINKITLRSTSPTLQVNRSAPETWKSRWQQSLNLLEKLVVIRHNNDEQYASVQQRGYVRENLHLHVLAASQAVLQKNKRLFNEALQRSIELINCHFDEQNAVVASLLQSLQNLQHQSFQTTLPRLTESLNLLNQYIEKNNNSPAPQSPKPEASL